jgi:hypothetical protein
VLPSVWMNMHMRLCVGMAVRGLSLGRKHMLMLVNVAARLRLNETNALSVVALHGMPTPTIAVLSEVRARRVSRYTERERERERPAHTHIQHGRSAPMRADEDNGWAVVRTRTSPSLAPSRFMR